MPGKTVSEWKKDPGWHDDMVHAYESAASLLEQEEFGGDNSERQNAAYRELARMIRRNGDRYYYRNC